MKRILIFCLVSLMSIAVFSQKNNIDGNWKLVSKSWTTKDTTAIYVKTQFITPHIISFEVSNGMYGFAVYNEADIKYVGKVEFKDAKVKMFEGKIFDLEVTTKELSTGIELNVSMKLPEVELKSVYIKEEKKDKK